MLGIDYDRTPISFYPLSLFLRNIKLVVLDGSHLPHHWFQGWQQKNHLLVDRFDTNAIEMEIEIEISFCRIISRKKIIMVKHTKHALSRLLWFNID